MGIRICSFASGSKGNCIYVAADKTEFLIDAGIPLASVKKYLGALGTDIGNVNLLITHTHADHIRCLNLYAPLCKAVYCCEDCAQTVEKQAKEKTVAFGSDFKVGDVLISPFAVSHDVPCVGYSFYYGNGKVSIATDLGCVSRDVYCSLAGSDIVMLEANHDAAMLAVNKKYPPILKKRILSDKGHLSNDMAAQTAVGLAHSGTRRFLLAHLSAENNTPELAYNAVAGALEGEGICVGDDVTVEVARQDRLTGIYEVSSAG